MSKVTDPDTLDRFQVCIDPVGQTISLRGLGTQRHAVDTTGDSDGTTTFTDAGANFTTDGVQVGDVLTIISDPAENGGIIGHYRVSSGIGTTTLVVDRAIPASTSANLTYKINAPQTVGSATPQVADGVMLDVLYSFLIEEWISLASGLGNAEDLNQFTFPLKPVPATVGQYVMGGVNGDASSAWAFASQNGTIATDLEGVPRELVRDGGWAERNAADLVLREYPNVTTLGTFDDDAQANYQQGDATGTPANFRLPGPVNQAILTFGPPITPTNIAFTATTITRSAGSWISDGYRVGDRVTIRSAEDAGNIGNFGPITSITATVITIASAAFTSNTDDDTATFLVDHRRYTVLRGRKKGRFYASAGHDDAGIPATGILPLVNKFPLGHSEDVAITLDDGLLSGGDDTGTSVFQNNEPHQGNTNGATTSVDGSTFTFTSSGATFTATARSVQILRPGDVLQIESGGYQGYYEISSIDSATQLTCYKEPLRTYPGNETALTYTVHTGIRDTGAANATLANVSGATGTLTSSGSTFDANNGLGDRTVVAGDIVEVYAGTNAVIGYYKVISVDSATVLTLNTSDQIFGGQTNQTYRIWRPGMFLQRFETNVVMAGATNMNFNGAGNPDTMTRTGGSWVTDGFTAGMAISILAAEDTANIGEYIIAGTPTATVVTLIAEESLTTNAADTIAINGNVTGDTGIVRTINSVGYPFHWRLFVNGGTLSQAYQFLAMQERRAYDIDGGNGLARGDITDLLMSYVSPNGVALDLFPDDLSSAELNNVTYQDLTGDNRNNPFLVGLSIIPNADLIGSTIKRITLYFDSVPSGDFDSNDAIIIDDSSGTDMNFTAFTGTINVVYDYTNNAQGGRTPNTDADYVLVAYSNGAVPTKLAGTITRVNSIPIPVQPAKEFNYANA
jgi:hypothetical protein